MVDYPPSREKRLPFQEKYWSQLFIIHPFARVSFERRNPISTKYRNRSRRGIRRFTFRLEIGEERGEKKGEEDWRVGEETYRSCRHRRGVGSCVPRVITGFPVVTHQRWRIPLNPAGLQAFGRPFGRRHGHGVSRHTGGFNAN